MRKTKFGRSLIACVLAFLMVFSTCSAALAEVDTFNYVSIGDSMTNGYCFEGYNQGAELASFFSENGEGIYGEAAYPNEIATWLGETHPNVKHTKLAPSAMRAEDLLYLLGGSNEPADDWYGEVENYTNCDDDAALSAHFIDAVENADFVTMCIGNASFGAFLLQQVTNAIGVMGSTPDIDPDIVFENAISMLDEEQKEIVTQIYDIIEANLGKYISDDIAEQYNIPAVLDIAAYTAAGFVISYAKCIERIVELNPDVEIMLIGLMNTTYGMTISGDGIDTIPFGDIMDGVFGILNSYIAGLPAVMQKTGKYEEAEFYYAEIDEIEFIVQKFDDLKEGNWEDIDGLSGETVRKRTIKSYNETLRLLIQGVVGTLPEVSLANVEGYESTIWVGNESDWATCYELYGGTDFAERATSVAIYLAIEDALSASVDTMDIPYEGLMKIAGDLTGIFAGAPMVSTSPKSIRESLAEYLSQDEFKPLCKIYSLFKIGDGMSVHPTPLAHSGLAERIKSAYSEKHTAKDETIANITALIKEYYDEAYAYADKHGYVDKAEEAIDKAIEVINTLDFSDTQMTDEFKAQLEAELQAIVETLEEIKVILAEDKASDVEGLKEVIPALKADLEAHLTNACALLQQAGMDIEELLIPVIDAYVAGLMADIEAELPKLGHKKYVAGEDSYYVALGGDTALGASLVYGETPYYALLAEKIELGADKAKGLGEERLLSSEVLEYVEANAAEIEKAELITYQADASSFIYALVEETPDWSKYVDEETSIAINKAIAKAEEILKSNWEDYANAELDKVIAEVKKPIIEALSEYITVNETVDSLLDGIIEMVVSYVRDSFALIEDKKNEAVSKLEGIDETVYEYAEKLIYAVVAYAIDTVKAVEAIQEINPDAALYVVGMYNPLRGLKVVAGENTVDAGEYFEYVIKATNLYYAGVAAANKNFAFVDASKTATKGFTEGDTIDISAINVNQLGSLVLSLADKMNATAEGHKYIAEQIATAMVCKAGAYEKLNGSYHNVLCSLCGEVVEKEKHDFDGKVCTLCGYEKSGSTGSSSSGGSAIKKEETASTLKFTDVSKDAWYYDVIRKIVAKGLMNGMSETEFAPELEVTRGMFVTILYRAAGEPEITATTNFTDVAAEQYYANAVAWAAANGIVNGMSETEFAPNQNITREQMAAILYRYAKTLKANQTAELTYTDKDTISGYALDAVAWAKAAGIMEGNEDGTFAPVRNASRAEAAAVFVRIIEILK